MNNSLKRTPLAAGILLALNSPFYSPPALAAPGDPVGLEFQVNTFTAFDQRFPSIAMDADGDFVIAWQGPNQDRSSYGIYAQRYQADGTAAGTEFQVNTEKSVQVNASIAMDADGDFVIAWASRGQDGDDDGIYAQRFQADGTATGLEFQVNTFTTGRQNKPSIAIDADGDFVIAWESRNQDGSHYGIYAQRYQADGIAAGFEFQVNTETTSAQRNPTVAMDADGDLVIAWQSFGQVGNFYDVYAQRYQADGTAAGGEFLVNTETNLHQDNPSIAMDADGDFVIAWESNDSDIDGIFAQRFQADGTADGAEFQVNTETTHGQSNPGISMDADGDFVITWESTSQDGSEGGIYSQRYQANGSVSGGEFIVNTFTDRGQREPSIALDADGDFVIAWASYQDGSQHGIYAQRYEGAGSSDVDLSLLLQDGTDPVIVGSSFMYSLIISNNGTESATDLILSDPIPAGLSYVSYDASSADWSCALSNTTINCNKALMTAGEVNTVNLSFTADVVGMLSNTVTVTATQTDANNSDNTDTETTTVIDDDTTAPVVTVLGDNPISVAQNTVFTDPGVTITDNVDKGLVATVTGNVDTATAGSYTLSYNVTDNAGNAAIEVQRTVIVVDTTIPVITLLGDNSISVNQNSAFTDPGVTITDNVDTALVATVTGNVDTATPGSYALSYNVTDSAGNAAIEVQRTVIVESIVISDTTAPVITLLGDNSISINQNGAFTDPGVTITDNVDTGLVATVTGSVDTASPGTYTLSYKVTDSAGNAAIEVQRTVIVVAASSRGGSFGISSLLLGLFLCLRRRRRS